MASNPADQFHIPPEMRAIAEKSVEQAKQAVESFISAAHRTATTLEDQAEMARKGAKDMGQKAIDFAGQNIASSFELAQKLVRAKDIQEMLELQSNYIRTQMQVMGEQAKELGQGASRLATDPLRPKS
jgi:phasin